MVVPLVPLANHRNEEIDMSVTDIHKTDAKAAIAKAEQEIVEEQMANAVGKLKTKLRDRNAAAVVIENIDREITDLKEAIEQGNA